MITDKALRNSIHQMFSREAYSIYVKHVCGLVGNEIALSIILSRLTREARRVHDTATAQSLFRSLLQRINFTDEPRPGVTVFVPDPTFRMGPLSRAIWEVTGTIIRRGQRNFGDDIAFGHLFCWTAQLAIQTFGAQDAKNLLNGIIDTMPEVSQFDID